MNEYQAKKSSDPEEIIHRDIEISHIMQRYGDVNPVLYRRAHACIEELDPSVIMPNEVIGGLCAITALQTVSEQKKGIQSKEGILRYLSTTFTIA